MKTKEPKRIIFTGGGTAGHVTPNIALIEKCREGNWEISYIGSKAGIEKELISKLNIPYYSISTGKLRRHFSFQNFIDPFKIILGFIQALLLCFKIKPNIVFSKGGFVSFPVVIAAWCLRIPVIVHESDLTTGLANKLSFPFATKICIAFPETADQIKDKSKVVITGIPIKKSSMNGDVNLGHEICKFTPNKKTLLVFGGSLGANRINIIVRELLPKILVDFQVVHICGKNKVDPKHQYPGYKQFEYLHEELPHVLAISDLVISRSGANSIYELLVLRKPHILLPLDRSASRGDQIINANYCANLGFSEVIFAEQLTAELLLEKIITTNQIRADLITKIEKFEILPATEIIYNLIETVAK